MIFGHKKPMLGLTNSRFIMQTDTTFTFSESL
jgi:hypothetical protein